MAGAGQLTFESTPLFADGVLYVTEPPTAVAALDARTGRRLWRWEQPVPRDYVNIGFPQTNRGVALLDTNVYVGTLDAHLVALDARSGVLRWDATVADYRAAYSITMAPLAVDGKIIVGVSGAEAGIRGFIDAYDARTGERLWRFYTIPAPGEPGSETWQGGESWETGGGSTWLTGSYDPALRLLYWGVGNPGPDWNGDPRPGDNLYTCSLVALDVDTGKLRWYFQFTPHDTHDWDANQIPVLFDARIAGVRRKLVALANRNGFYYVLDRVTGAYVRGVQYAPQSWAAGLDTSGRPIPLPGKEPSVEGTLVYPSLQGSANWHSPAYSPQTGLFYAAVREMGSYYYKADADYKPGQPFLGGGERALAGDSAHGALRALDAVTGRQRWQFALYSPPWAGVMATAGGVVFSGTNEGNFYALDARTGQLLWEFQTGGLVRSGPMSFMLDGHQHVAVTARRNLYVFSVR
jgi:alcohol dehydrogenase (cytochrome c)